jgi:pyrimidine deaminase RibD-like protein
MRLAIEQGELVKGHTYPNPPVGAVFSTVVYAVADPNPIAAGGATHLLRPAWPICLDQIASGRTASVHRDLLIGLRK